VSNLDPFHRSACSLRDAVCAGRLTAQEVLERCYARISRTDPHVHAFLTLSEDRAVRAAEKVDSTVRGGGDPGLLAGVPIAVKDNISTRGVRTTCASRLLEAFVPVFDATAVERVEAAGGLIVGKTNLDEFGMGSSTEHSAFGPTRNPWNLGSVPGGSSGGSAAAVAAGMVPLALGTDTGGSVRQPGAFCGLVGMKPQYGTISRWGLVAFASSFDCIGPLARSAADCAVFLRVLQGRDPRDATSLDPQHQIAPGFLDGSVEGLRIGLPVGWLGEAAHTEVLACLKYARGLFCDLGIAVSEVELPDPRYAVSTYYLIANAEASSNLARFDGVRYGRRSTLSSDLLSLYECSRGEGFGAEVKRRILLGTFVLSTGYYEDYYLRAQCARERLRCAFEQVVSEVDAILIPTAPTTAFRLGEKLEDPLMMVLSDLYTILPNLLQVPAITFPAGRSSRGLPIGLQLIGRAHGEATLLRLVHAFEKAHGDEGSARGEQGPAFPSPHSPPDPGAQDGS
jgi:aspartyl-tRNA(Asn)/glutamyl-tRNA(Gln) amidotransferase subunit A